MNESPISISPEETEELFAKLEGLADGLTEPQDALLKAIIKIARDVTEVGEDGQGLFDEQFCEAFTPFPIGTTGAVLAYMGSPPAPGGIIRGTTTSSPASIIRSSPHSP